jgi:hypothetical protein
MTGHLLCRTGAAFAAAEGGGKVMNLSIGPLYAVASVTRGRSGMHGRGINRFTEDFERVGTGACG